MVQFNTKDNEILVKIVFYGPGLSGKTTNLQKLHELMDPSQKTDLFSVNTMEDRTLFFDLLPVDLGYIYGNSIKLQIYTVPGQVHYDSTRRIVLSGADGVIFIADSSKAKLHENVQSINNLYHNLQANRINIKEIPLVMQFNKRDLPDALPVDVLNKKLNFRNIPYFCSVAIKGEGVLETFAEAVKQTVKTIFEKYQLSKSVKNLNEVIEKLNSSIMAKAKAAEKSAAEEDVVVPKVRLGGKTVLKYTHSIEDDDRSSQDQLLQKALTSNMETARLYTDLKNSQQALMKKNEELSVLYKQLERSNNDNNKIRRFLESLVNFAGDAIISFNDLWVIQNWNQAAEQLFGYKRTEILNQNINLLFPDEGMAELNRIITIVTNGKVVKGFETNLITKDKSQIPVSITFSPIKNKNETIIAFTAIIRDLSAMNQMQNHLFAIQKYEALGYILPIVSKRMASEDGINSPVLKMVLDAFSSSETQDEKQTFSINQFLEEIKDLFSEELEKKNISWITQLNPHLPEIKINARLFIQGFMNLLINAVESVMKTEEPKITLGTHFMDGQVLLQLINNGHGIPPEAMNQVFSSSYDEEILTMNLRLRTARQLFTQQNTLMRVDSSLKKGTKITLKIPQEHSED